MRRKKKGQGDSDAAKVWPDIENDGKGEAGDKTEVRARSKPHPARQLSDALVNVGIGITFAEAVQNSSTIYGVRVACETIPTRQSSSEKLIRPLTRRRQSLSLPRGNSTP